MTGSHGTTGAAASAAPGAHVRVVAVRALLEVFDGQSLRAVLPVRLETLSDSRDRALCESICFHVLRWRRRYEALLAQLLQRPLTHSLREVQVALLVGVAQIEGLQLAPHAAVASTAEAVRQLGHPRHVGLVNAVLRRLLREAESLPEKLPTDPGVASSHPEWLVERLRSDWPDDWQQILQANNVEAPMWLRVNRLRGDRNSYLRQLQDATIECHAPAQPEAAVELPRGGAPTALPGWEAGLVSVQDVSAQFAAIALEAGPDQRVLDACAAPGGKTAHLLESGVARGGGELVALDIDERRLQRMQVSLQRLGHTATLRVADASTPRVWHDGRPFERILIDAPCSASGIIRRQPDIKWHRRAGDLPRLMALQAQLLDALWPLLAPGGRLVYATCSVLRDENERQIDAFLARHPDALACPLDDAMGRVAGSGRQRLPGEQGGDGFFLAALQKPAVRVAVPAVGRLPG